MCSNIICHIYTRPLFLRRAQKPSAEPPRTKSIRWASIPSTLMSQHSRFRCVMVRLVFNISAISWRNKTVQGSSSISQTTHTTTSTHLGPKCTAPRPLHHGTYCPPNWCQRPFYLTSRLWLRPDHEMHSELNLDARNKDVNSCDSNKLISKPLHFTAKKINPLCLDAFNTDGAELQVQMRHGTICLQHLCKLLAE